MTVNEFLFLITGIVVGASALQTINNFYSCKHDWTKWEHYLLTMQKRKCKKCGLRQERD